MNAFRDDCGVSSANSPRQGHTARALLGDPLPLPPYHSGTRPGISHMAHGTISHMSQAARAWRPHRIQHEHLLCQRIRQRPYNRHRAPVSPTTPGREKKKILKKGGGKNKKDTKLERRPKGRCIAPWRRRCVRARAWRHARGSKVWYTRAQTSGRCKARAAAPEVARGRDCV